MISTMKKALCFVFFLMFVSAVQAADQATEQAPDQATNQSTDQIIGQVKEILHSHGIHVSAIQPEFSTDCLEPECESKSCLEKQCCQN